MKQILLKVTILLSLISGTHTSISQHNLTGYWQDNFGMHYYIRHSGNDIYWFGEHKDGQWSGAFKGRISNNNIRAIIGGHPINIRGQVYDLPKGKAGTQASLGLKVISDNELRKTSGPFSATVFRKKTLPRSLPGNRSAGFSSAGITGLWTGNDGGQYYMRQVGNTIIWYGEKTSGRSTAFANVAFGTKSGNNIQLEWADVPKGRTRGKGTLRLKIADNTISKISGYGFGGSRWTKANKKEINTALVNLLLSGYANQISVHINNYAARNGSPRWYKANDAYVNLPRDWGGRYSLEIPEISQKKLRRTYRYYVNELNSAPRGVSIKLKPKFSLPGFLGGSRETQKQPIINLAIKLETDGTEIKGRCTKCPSSDKGAPDVHISKKNDQQYPIIYVHIPLVVKNGKISYETIQTHFDATIKAGGICKIMDKLCNRITNYREIIRSEIDKGFKTSLESYTVKNNIETSLNSIVPNNIKGKITKLVMEGDKLIIEHR